MPMKYYYLKVSKKLKKKNMTGKQNSTKKKEQKNAFKQGSS